LYFKLNFIADNHKSKQQHMGNSKAALFLIVLCAAISVGCRDSEGKKTSLNSMANEIGRKSMIEEYPKVPSDDLVREIAGNRLYAELQNRYAQHLLALKAETERDQAKFIVLIMTPEVGKYATNANLYGNPYIVQLCSNQGIDCIDITPDISEWTAVNDARRAPMSGNWSKEGAAFTAQMIAGVVAKYDDYRNRKTYTAEERPVTFGDTKKVDEKNDDDYYKNPQDGTKRNSYRFTVNKQGLRMGHELTFPKTRQRVLFLGDSRILNPFMDDEYTITELLQKRFPDKEIVNAGNLSYTMDDYLTLYHEKARYMEPDVVVVCTNGGDILDEYFSHRNRYSRSGKCYRPTELEKQFYTHASAGN
jgi:hypothetical protein